MSSHPSPGSASESTPAGRIVDAFEVGRARRAAEDAAEIRLLAHAAAGVSTPAGASIELRCRLEWDRRALIAELATSTRVSEWTVARLLSESADLCARFALAVDALEHGRISREHLTVIHDVGDPIDDEHARDQFVRIAIDRAEALTPRRLAPALTAIAERFIERPVERRHADAVATRDVRVIDLADGMATLAVTHEAVLIHGIHDRLTAQGHSILAARAANSDSAAGSYGGAGGIDAAASDSAAGSECAAGGDGAAGGASASITSDASPGAGAPGSTDTGADTRTMDQLRADIATDLLLTAGPDDCVAGTGLAAIRATVQVTVPVLTMTGVSDEPCLLAGYGPIDPGTARALTAAEPRWERVMTSPVTGNVLAVDRYRPGASLSRYLGARDEHCRFPGCRMPVRRCDLDHTIDHARGGPTSHRNLAHLCRRHHVLKHSTAWTVQQTTPGVLVWTSPAGRRHTDRPEPTVRFVPDPDLIDRRRILREPWLFPVDDPPSTGEPPF
ncbi:HNH endonuclease signature motif containing protein [Microbacterium cremeum]|uniref:HNH endonuclease signature motif containing protein n=1 Tax=Microbacterium cremeum TaxID=2782169 RepID=UPI00188934F6|nr:HNH endonuclease signature motif containing protein [Microbacterium cremeum]